MGHNKDILWKGLLEWVFDDLLRFLYPDADEVFDLKVSPGFMDKEFAALSPEPVCKITVRAVDKLVKVKLRNKAQYALVHLEVQGQTKKSDRRLFGERMFGYFNLILAHHRRPLASIAIFTGSDGHLMPAGQPLRLGIANRKASVAGRQRPRAKTIGKEMAHFSKTVRKRPS